MLSRLSRRVCTRVQPVAGLAVFRRWLSGAASAASSADLDEGSNWNPYLPRRKKAVDLRSDTVTLPDARMILAMMDAVVGDDVYGEDPTVNALEAHTAELLNKDAALFVASGTMGNLLAVASHCQRGDEVILGDESHIFHYEGGGASALFGVPFHPVANAADGTLPLAAVEAAIRDSTDSHYARTRLVAVENTQNRCMGAVLTPEYMDSLGDLCKRRGLALHVDGARLFNAAAALKVRVDRLVEAADSVSICLSKGLGAPVGSVLAGSEEFIARARRWRKVVGGGMRQAGIVAASGLVGLKENVARLEEDHRNAKALARGLQYMPGVTLDLDRVQTNIVYFHVDQALGGADAFVKHMEAGGFKMGAYGSTKVRAVTHLQVSPADIEATLDAASKVLKKLKEVSK